MPQNFKESEVSEEFLNQVEEAYNMLISLAKEYSTSFDGELTPTDLDILYPILKKGTRWNKERRETSISLLGAGLGKLMVDHLGFKWIEFEDEQGKDIAVKHDESDWIAFPFSSVQKRIRKRDRPFFKALYDSFQSDIQL